MKILFITSSWIGDAVLSTGLLRYIDENFEDARVTIACGPLAASLFEGYSKLEKIIPLKKEKNHKHWVKLWKRVVKTRWGMVIDLRDSAVSRLIRSEQRFVFGPHIDRNLHKVQQNAAIMKLFDVPAPKLWFTDEQEAHAKELVPDGGAVLGVGPTANWIGKIWPAERFVEIVKFMTQSGGVMEGARVAVFGAPGEEEAAHEVLSSVPEDRRLDVIAKTDPGTAAAALSRFDFYLGNDSGLMHCAAACDVPTLGLFGPSYPHLYAPWGVHTDYIRTPKTFDQLIDFEGYDAEALDHTLMEGLSVEAVKKRVKSMF